jgi:hypothetical protein
MEHPIAYFLIFIYSIEPIVEKNLLKLIHEKRRIGLSYPCIEGKGLFDNGRLNSTQNSLPLR